MVAVEKVRKRQLEEEIAEAERKEFAEQAKPPAFKQPAAKEIAQGELSRVEVEAVKGEKVEEAREKKEQVVAPKENISAEKPELGSALDEQAASVRSRQHQTTEEVFRDQADLQSKAAELRERSLDERIRSEKLAEEQKLFSDRFKGGGKKEKAPEERRRIRRPPTEQETRSEERKARRLEVLRRRDEIRKKLDAQDASKKKVIGRIEWLQLKLSVVLSRVRSIFRLK